LSDNEKLNIFNLPENIDESFLFSYTPTSTNIEIFLNINSKDNNWYFKNDRLVKINEDVEVKLEELKTYQLKILGTNSEFFLFTNPSNNKIHFDVSIQNMNIIKIGKSPECDLIYNNELTNDVQCIITEENGLYYIRNPPGDGQPVPHHRAGRSRPAPLAQDAGDGGLGIGGQARARRRLSG
jgi:hypothetical protein